MDSWSPTSVKSFREQHLSHQYPSNFQRSAKLSSEDVSSLQSGINRIRFIRNKQASALSHLHRLISCQQVKEEAVVDSFQTFNFCRSRSTPQKRGIIMEDIINRNAINRNLESRKSGIQQLRARKIEWKRIKEKANQENYLRKRRLRNKVSQAELLIRQKLCGYRWEKIEKVKAAKTHICSEHSKVRPMPKQNADLEQYEDNLAMASSIKDSILKEINDLGLRQGSKMH